jgi:hypothetical protein
MVFIPERFAEQFDDRTGLVICEVSREALRYRGYGVEMAPLFI